MYICTYVGDVDEVFHDLTPFPSVWPAENRLDHPVDKLVTEMSNGSQKIRMTITFVFNRMNAAIVSLFLSDPGSRTRCRHSAGRIFLYSANSMRVNCLAISSGSISRTFKSLVLGTMGVGGAVATAYWVLTLAFEPCCCMHRSERL